jgi:hypothetical protein
MFGTNYFGHPYFAQGFADPLIEELSGVIAATSTLAANLTRWRALGGAIAAVSTLSGNLFVVWFLQGTIAAASVIGGSLTVQRRTPPLASVTARARLVPLFADAWQQPKEPPDG